MSKKKASREQKIRIGIQPTGWTNDDFQETGDENDPQWYLLATGLNEAWQLARENGMHFVLFNEVASERSGFPN
jgi:hypothetical protein